MAACRLLMRVSWGCYHYAGNRGIRCSDENSGLQELVAIAQPMRGEELHVGESSAVFSSGAWINQQLPQDAHPHSLTIEDPTPVADGDGRLWLFFRIPGHTLMLYLNQTNTNGSEWGIDTKFPPTEVFLTAND